MSGDDGQPTLIDDLSREVVKRIRQARAECFTKAGEPSEPSYDFMMTGLFWSQIRKDHNSPCTFSRLCLPTTLTKNRYSVRTGRAVAVCVISCQSRKVFQENPYSVKVCTPETSIMAQRTTFMTLPPELRERVDEYIALTHTKRRFRTVYRESISASEYKITTSAITATCRITHNEYEDGAR